MERVSAQCCFHSIPYTIIPKTAGCHVTYGVNLLDSYQLTTTQTV